MNHENVAVVTDSGCSMRPEYPRVKELDVTILPLEIRFPVNGGYEPVDDLSLTDEEFYQKLRSCREKLPQTSGSIQGQAIEAYCKLLEDHKSIVSIHLTSKHSAVYASALNAAVIVAEKMSRPWISVIDSKTVSLGTWFLVDEAAKLAKQGANDREIVDEISGLIPKIRLVAALDTLENAVKGGRLPFLVGYLGAALQIKPILEVKDGELKEIGRKHGTNSARKELIQLVKNESHDIARMAILHTNVPGPALEAQAALAEFYNGEIPIVEAGPVIAVHGGEGAVGIVYQRV